MSTIKVAVVGATGRTGGSIVNALLDSADPKFVRLRLLKFFAIVSPSNVKLTAAVGSRRPHPAQFD